VGDADAQFQAFDTEGREGRREGGREGGGIPPIVVGVGSLDPGADVAPLLKEYGGREGGREGVEKK
jgi:hypothetical protein